MTGGYLQRQLSIRRMQIYVFPGICEAVTEHLDISNTRHKFAGRNNVQDTETKEKHLSPG